MGTFSYLLHEDVSWYMSINDDYLSPCISAPILRKGEATKFYKGYPSIFLLVKSVNDLNAFVSVKDTAYQGVLSLRKN